MLGIATKRSIATRQEVQAAKERQAPGPKIAKPIEADPWALESEPSMSNVPVCGHGQPMIRKTGLKKNGDPYGGWVCAPQNGADKCEPLWDRS